MHAMDRPTWLVTGAQGFLGANIGAALAGRAHRIGATRRIPETTELFDRYVASDLQDPADLCRSIAVLRPDVIVHAAALASHEECEADPNRARRINALASHELARAAQAAGSRFVLISTDAVFDGVEGGYREGDATNPTSVYGRTKVEAEELVCAETDALVVRTNFFGWSPSGRRSILEFFVTSLSNGQQVRGFTDFTTSSAYAPELAKAIWELLDVGASGIVHVTSPDRLTKYEFGVAVADAFGLDAGLISPQRSQLDPPREGDISLNVSHAESLIGRSLPTMRAGIELAHADSPTLRASVRTP